MYIQKILDLLIADPSREWLAQFQTLKNTMSLESFLQVTTSLPICISKTKLVQFLRESDRYDVSRIREYMSDQRDWVLELSIFYSRVSLFFALSTLGRTS